MGSTFDGIEISKRGLNVHQAALNTTGHNISNADNKDYARQRVSLESMEPLYNPSYNRASTPGQLGQGARVASVQRVRESFYDDQVITAENSKNQWEARHLYLTQIEHVFNEPSDNTLRSLMDRFWSSWQELANYPSDMAHREVVIERARALTTGINSHYKKLELLQQRANQEVQTDVAQINSLATDIRDLNERILKLQTLGDNPNDLLDRRDAALEKLGALADIRVGRGDKDELIVFIGEQALIQGEIQRKLITQADSNKEGLHNVLWEHNQKELVIKGGHLYGLLEIRDIELVKRIGQIDSYAVNIADIVNEAHRDGFGLNGVTNKDFFHIRPLSPNADASFLVQNKVGDYDLDQDGTAEVTALFRVTGRNTVKPEERLGISGVLSLSRNDEDTSIVSIDYRANDTLLDVVKRINDSKVGVVAYVNHDKQLALKATTSQDGRNSRKNFMIRHIEDSGELLVGYAGILNASGATGAFDYRRIGEISKLQASLQDMTLTPIFHPGGHLELSEDLANDPASIAAARGRDVGGTGDYNTPNGASDGSNALTIAAALKQDKRMIGHAVNPEEFYNALIANLGTESRAAEDAVNRYKDDLVALNALRQSVMGVNLDEEMSNMIQFQHAYNASARMLQVQNEILDMIIMRMGA